MDSEHYAEDNKNEILGEIQDNITKRETQLLKQIFHLDRERYRLYNERLELQRELDKIRTKKLEQANGC